MRLKHRALELLLAVVSLVVSLLPLLTTDRNLLFTLGVVVAVALIIAAIVLSIRRKEQISPHAVIVDASLAPAGTEDIKWISDLQKDMFGKTAVPLQVLSEWYDANPNGFHIVNACGEPIGHLDVLPVKPEPLKLFTDGVIDEKGIRGSSLFRPDEHSQVRDLYIESLIVNGRSKAIHDAGVTELLKNLKPIFTTLGDPEHLRYVFAVGATPAGIKFMEEKGFEKVGKPEDRVDHLPLYRILYATFMKKIYA